MIEVEEQIIPGLSESNRFLPSSMSKTSSRTFKIYQDFLRLKNFSKLVGLHPIHLIGPSILALFATIFEGISVGLLIPALKGLIDRNYDFAKALPVLKNIFNLFPEAWIQRNATVFALLISFIFVAAVADQVSPDLQILQILGKPADHANEARTVGVVRGSAI